MKEEVRFLLVRSGCGLKIFFGCWMNQELVSFMCLLLHFFVLCCWVRIKTYLEISLGTWAFQFAYSRGFSLKSFSQCTEGSFHTKYVIMFTDSSQQRMNSPRSHCDLIWWPYQCLALTERFSQNSLSAPHGRFLYLLNVYLFEVWRLIWGLTHTRRTFSFCYDSASSSAKLLRSNRVITK